MSVARCPMCSEPFDTAQRFKDHLAQVHGLSDDPGRDTAVEIGVATSPSPSATGDPDEDAALGARGRSGEAPKAGAMQAANSLFQRRREDEVARFAADAAHHADVAEREAQSIRLGGSELDPAESSRAATAAAAAADVARAAADGAAEVARVADRVRSGREVNRSADRIVSLAQAAAEAADRAMSAATEASGAADAHAAPTPGGDAALREALRASRLEVARLRRERDELAARLDTLEKRS